MKFAPDDVFTLASDVEDYPNFIKFINAIRIQSDVIDGDVRMLLAEVRVRYKFIRERFSTHVALNPIARTLATKLARGPFRSLSNRWVIHPLDDGSSLIEFIVAYEFNVPFLGQFLAAREDKAAHFIINAFEGRAAERFSGVGGDEQAVQAQIASIKGLN